MTYSILNTVYTHFLEKNLSERPTKPDMIKTFQIQMNVEMYFFEKFAGLVSDVYIQFIYL